ncbi:MAG: SAM-dependent methyltransferase [Propionibacteriaceae bacterium]|nr:SAM-dependent methyltransferase [Propionibacteriaceae bacterium]
MNQPDAANQPDTPIVPVPRAARLAALDAALPLLACPHCHGPLRREQSALACPAGHRFDIARAGYVNLLGHAAPANADTPAMVAARERFLGAGAYDPIADAVAAVLARVLPPRDAAIAEFGAGPGFYLAAVRAAAPPHTTALATDISPAAARRAAGRGLASVVADTWAGLPVADACLDGVCCVFAPRNPAELARVVRPGGTVVLVTPARDHLVELRERLGLLAVRPDAGPAAWQALRGAGFDVDVARPITYALRVEPAQARDLVEMGPNAHHAHGSADEPLTVTVSVELATAQRRR